MSEHNLKEYNKGYQDAKKRHDADMLEAVDILDKCLRCWRGTMPRDPSIAIVRGYAQKFIDQYRERGY